MKSSRYRHYRNRAEAGDCIFATTTTIDFAPIFKSLRLADLAMSEVLAYAIETGVKLHSFALMHHHLHLVLRLNDHQTGSAWMQQMKSRTSRILGTKLTERQRVFLCQQVGLNKRSLWKRSFRSIRIEDERIFWQKVRYTHLNPLRSELCKNESEYRWSSKRFWEAGLWTEEGGLELLKVREDFTLE